MKIDRYQGTRRRKSNNIALISGCMTFGVIAIILTGVMAAYLFPMLPSLILPFFGLEEVGDVDTVFDVPVDAVPQINDVQAVGSVVLSTNSYSQTFQGAGNGYNVIIGNTADQNSQMQISFTESGLLAQCRTLTTICSSSGDVVRNASFDLRPNGLIINGNFEVQNGVRQDAGLVMSINSQNRLEIVGVQIGETVFAPSNANLGNIITQAENEVNLILTQLTAQATGTTYILSDIIIDDANLTLVMQ